MKLLIEPPEPVRVASALEVLEGVGALDPEQKVCNKQIKLLKQTLRSLWQVILNYSKDVPSL